MFQYIPFITQLSGQPLVVLTANIGYRVRLNKRYHIYVNQTRPIIIKGCDLCSNIFT